MPSISKRGINTPDSPYRKLAPLADQAKEKGRHVYHLNIGQPDIPSPPHCLQQIQGQQPEIIAYGSAQGIPELRTVYANYYQGFEAKIQADDVFVTTGASEAIVFAMAVCCDNGDEIIIPEPFYASYNSFANFVGANVVPIPSFLEESFALPKIQDFKSRITDRTKAIVLCNPGNPTGNVYSQSDIESILDIAIEKDIFLIVDEVYKEFCYDAKFCSALQFEKGRDHVIIIDSVSKIFSLCGARIGFICTRNKALQSAILLLGKMRLCPSYHGQELALAAFKNLHPYLDEVKAEYLLRRNVLYAELKKIAGLTLYKPAGAFYIVAGLPIDNAERFCAWMLKDYHYQNETVMFAPASGFYSNVVLGEKQIRIAFVLNSKDIRKAITCLAEGLKAYQALHTQNH